MAVAADEIHAQSLDLIASLCSFARTAAALISSSVTHSPGWSLPSVPRVCRFATRCVTCRLCHRAAQYRSSISAGSLSSRCSVGCTIVMYWMSNSIAVCIAHISLTQSAVHVGLCKEVIDALVDLFDSLFEFVDPIVHLSDVREGPVNAMVYLRQSRADIHRSATRTSFPGCTAVSKRNAKSCLRIWHATWKGTAANVLRVELCALPTRLVPPQRVDIV
eukprot:3314589-Rhodomonas_salina.2